MTDKIDAFHIRGPDGVVRGLDEHYGGMKDVEEDAYGAWLAIQNLWQGRDEAYQRGYAQAIEDAAGVCTNVIKDYDVMEPGKPNQYASLKTQKAAKGMVQLAREEIRALAEQEG